MVTGQYGRTLLVPPVNRRWAYHHEFEHRGHGIIAIYSYGPAGEHEALVAEARRVMRTSFGVGQAVSSGGVSGYPERRPTPDPDWRTATEETQTIFCVHAVSGPHQPKLKKISPRQADWCLEYIVDVSQDYLGDGSVTQYFTGPLEDEDTWRELVDRDVCEVLSKDEAGAIVLELTVRATPQGSYWFLNEGDPVVSVERFEVTP